MSRKLENLSESEMLRMMPNTDLARHLLVSEGHLEPHQILTVDDNTGTLILGNKIFQGVDFLRILGKFYEQKTEKVADYDCIHLVPKQTPDYYQTNGYMNLSSFD